MTAPAAPAHDIVLEVLEGCAPFARAEAQQLGEANLVGPTEVRLRTADLTGVKSLRRVVAAYLVLRIPARRPTELLETSVQQEIAESIALIRRSAPKPRFTGVRLRAAGADTAPMRRLESEIAAGADLPVQEDGDLVVRVRKAKDLLVSGRSALAPALPPGPAWELLIRLTPRPLATRAWRTVNYPGAVNAAIAASALDILDVGAEDSLLDMTCGSGTFLIEQLHEAVPERIVGVDLSAEALAAASAHQRAARRRGRIDWLQGDVLTMPLEGGFTRLISNPPWGTLLGEHETNEELLRALLRRAEELAAPSARLAILTHEIGRMEYVIAGGTGSWSLLQEHRFFQKGHHPRLFVFERTQG